MKVLLTKEFDEENAELAKRCGIELIFTPFISTKQQNIDEATIEWFRERYFDIWIFTSAVAAHYAAELLKTDKVELPKMIYTVGEKTARALQNRGIPIIYPDESNAESLAALIIECHKNEKYCYFRGNISLKTIETKLQSAGIAISSIECYTTVLCKPVISPEMYDSIVFFSPSAVDAFVQSGLSHINKKIFAIGSTTAAAIYTQIGARAIVPNEKGFNGILKCLEANS